ncbi:MAG: hypothetical protein ACKOHM_06235 [Spartobacteria bacterium]
MKKLPKIAKSHIAGISFAVATASLPCLLQAQSAGENLLINGDAEAGDISGWTNFIETSTTANAGAYSFVLAGAEDSSSTAQSKELIPVDPSSGYTVSGYFMSPEGQAKVFLGVDCFDAQKRRITSQSITPVPQTETELVEDVKPGDKVVKIKNGSAWEFDAAHTPKYGVVAFNVDDSGAYSDLPNPNLSPMGITTIRQTGGQWEVELAKPLKEGYSAGTKVRQQKCHRAALWLVVRGVEKKWVKMSGNISGVSTVGQEEGMFWPGTSFVRVSVANLNNDKDDSPKVLVDDLTFGPNQ